MINANDCFCDWGFIRTKIFILIHFRLAFYERRGLFTRPRDLLADARSHYKSQLVQQVYVLVLGLDILGNPFGLLKDFTRGLGDFFYEPFLVNICHILLCMPLLVSSTKTQIHC